MSSNSKSAQPVASAAPARAAFDPIVDVEAVLRRTLAEPVPPELQALAARVRPALERDLAVAVRLRGD